MKTLLSLLISIPLVAQDYELSLWPEGVPNNLTTDLHEQQEQREILWITQVQNPEIAVFLPAKQHATSQAVLICPGGGYGGLAYDWEGTDIAKWLNSNGIAGIVLKYRLPSLVSQTEPSLVPLQDAKQAMRLIRQNAIKWNIDSQKVGVMGFSAGGHLASTLGTNTGQDDGNSSNEDLVITKPNFLILIYPVISMFDDITHVGSRTNLLGENPSTAMIQRFSNELKVNKLTPPTFLVHSMDDKAVPVANSLRFYQALQKHQIPAEMHLYPHGGHGYSLALDDGHLRLWPLLLSNWLKSL
ncbi:MAG: beta-xylanase [Cyclobacteriaceae bacterium]|nr:MAG: beta-xylanase [Cyclobacteriaceae bacterium]